MFEKKFSKERPYPDDIPYLDHLVSIHPVQTVRATQDIFDQHKTRLLEKNAHIDPSSKSTLLSALSQQPLLIPLDHCIALENELTEPALLAHYRYFLEVFPQFKRMHGGFELDDALQSMVAQTLQHPLIAQKLTVLMLRMPQRFEFSIAVSWLSMVIALRQERSQHQQMSAFIAGLTMDIGYLHLPQASIQDEETHGNVQATDNHPILSWQILSTIDTLDPAIAKAVLEHHERCDGSGFPYGKFRDELGITGQIIAMASLVIHHQMPDEPHQQKHLADMLPALQVNALVHKYEVYETTSILCRQWAHAHVTQISEHTIDAYIDRILTKNQLLREWIQHIDEMIMAFANEQEDRSLLTIKQTYVHILGSAYSSGFLDENYARWLQHVQKEKVSGVFREIEEVGLLMDEIEKHLQQTTRLFERLMNQSSTKYELYEPQINQGLQHIQRLLRNTKE